MHILITNDDGPPGVASPFIKSFIDALKAAGHTLSICLPHEQKSWIGKAHQVGHVLTPFFYRPDTDSTHQEARDDGGEEWVLVNGTPAACSQIGLHHFFKERGEVDLVISGPNFGRNSSAVYAMSSGTLGGGFEAALSGYKSISVSYAYKTKNHDWDIVREASDISVKIIENMSKNWPEDSSVDLYSVNVPLESGISKPRILFTNILQNTWSGCYKAMLADAQDEEYPDPNAREKHIREGTATPITQNATPESTARKVATKKFKWAPNFQDVQKAAKTQSAEGSDAWALEQGFISVTPLKANFFHGPGIGGELVL